MAGEIKMSTSIEEKKVKKIMKFFDNSKHGNKAYVVEILFDKLFEGKE